MLDPDILHTSWYMSCIICISVRVVEAAPKGRPADIHIQTACRDPWPPTTYVYSTAPHRSFVWGEGELYVGPGQGRSNKTLRRNGLPN